MELNVDDDEDLLDPKEKARREQEQKRLQALLNLKSPGTTPKVYVNQAD
ncbi:MAG: hypothetical protein OXF79_02150 [Chloroflexi bacterium]|nr:hypothetical protein [Chloroflexota bacterium]